MNRIAALVTTVALTLITPAVVPASTSADADLARDIQRAIESSAYFTVFDDVALEIDHDGTVILSGYVTAQHKRTDIANRVSAVDGVNDVENDITVLPVSRFDTELRYQVARSIYGSSTFWHYAARRNPPIHIVVEEGHVTLTGYVDSEADRAMAGILASNSAALSLTNDLKLSHEARTRGLE